MVDTGTDVVVLRKGTEGLSMEAYARALSNRLDGLSVFHARTPAEEDEGLREARVATGIHLDEEQLALAENLELFVCTFAGTDHLPRSAFAENDIAVVNAGGIHAPGIAEQAIGYALSFARRLPEAWRRKRRSEWRHFQSSEFGGSTVTIVGLGSIGQAIVKRLQGFDVETIGIRYTPEKGGPTDEVIGFDPEAVHTALARTDYLMVATPLTETTRGLIGEAELATLPPNAVLINVARGGLVETPALVSALQRSGIRGAALDVTDPEPLPPDHVLYTLENVIITPHTGGHTPKHWERLADILVENVELLDAGASKDELRNYVPPD